MRKTSRKRKRMPEEVYGGQEGSEEDEGAEQKVDKNVKDTTFQQKRQLLKETDKVYVALAQSF